MNEEQERVFKQINLEEIRKGITHQRTMLNRILAHVDYIDDPMLNLEVIRLDETLSRINKRVWTMEREAANHVATA